MSYNEEKVDIAVKTARFAEVGFMAQVREIAEGLANCSYAEVKVIAEQLNQAVEIMESLEADIDYYRKRCVKEID